MVSGVIFLTMVSKGELCYSDLIISESDRKHGKNECSNVITKKYYFKFNSDFNTTVLSPFLIIMTEIQCLTHKARNVE